MIQVLRECMFANVRFRGRSRPVCAHDYVVLYLTSIDDAKQLNRHSYLVIIRQIASLSLRIETYLLPRRLHIEKMQLVQEIEGQPLNTDAHVALAGLPQSTARSRLLAILIPTYTQAPIHDVCWTSKNHEEGCQDTVGWRR